MFAEPEMLANFVAGAIFSGRRLCRGSSLHSVCEEIGAAQGRETGDHGVVIGFNYGFRPERVVMEFHRGFCRQKENLQWTTWH